MIFAVEALLLLVLLKASLFEIGNTASTDTIFLWGVHGLSVWHPSPVESALSWLQLVAYVGAVGLTAMGALAKRRKALFAGCAGGAVLMGLFAACAHGWVLAKEPEDLLPDYSALLLAFGLVAGFAVHAALLARSARRAHRHAEQNARPMG